MRAFLLWILAGCLSVHGQGDVEWVTVGDAGNPPDKTGYGAVTYKFQIMKREVTCGQYAAFLNAVAATDTHGLYIRAMDGTPMPKGQDDIRTEQGCLIRTGEKGSYHYAVVPGHERKPIVNVDFLKALRFANWMHHGGGKGDTETGAYDIAKLGAMATRTPVATVCLPNENEWHKAAYYDPKHGGYWRFATRSDDVPESAKPDAKRVNAANFYWTKGHAVTQVIGEDRGVGIIYLTDVGSYPASPSYYGTLDQSGNAWEWTESMIYETKRVIRGGGFASEAITLRANTRSNASPAKFYPDTGFRLVRAMPKGGRQ
jgi:formylglycine-generating enzyme required for sulfatase activity